MRQAIAHQLAQLLARDRQHAAERQPRRASCSRAMSIALAGTHVEALAEQDGDEDVFERRLARARFADGNAGLRRPAPRSCAAAAVRRRRVAGQQHVRGVAELRDAGHQRRGREHADGGIGLLGVQVDDPAGQRRGELARRAHGDALPVAQHAQPVTAHRLVHVVRRDQDGGAVRRRGRRASPRSAAGSAGRRPRSARRAAAARARGWWRRRAPGAASSRPRAPRRGCGGSAPSRRRR